MKENPTKEQIAEDIFYRLDCKDEQTKKFIALFLDHIQLFDKKQLDYGRENIAKFGEQGVLVRTSDKLERLINLNKIPKEFVVIDPSTDTSKSISTTSPGSIIKVEKGRTPPKSFANIPANEAIEDTWMDIANYAIIAQLCRKGEW